MPSLFAFGWKETTQMSRRCRLVSIIAALLCWTQSASAQDAPVVEVITEQNAPSETQNVVEDLDDGVEPAIVWRLPVKISASVGGGYSDNVNTSSFHQQGSFFTTANVSVLYDFGTTRTRGGISASTGMTYYPDVSGSGYDPNFFLNFTLSHQVNLRLSLTSRINFVYSEGDNFADDASPNRRDGYYLYGTGFLSAAYQWLPRLSTVSTYTFRAFHYEQASEFDSRDRSENRFSHSFRYLMLPATTLVAEYRVGFVDYEEGDEDYVTQSILGGVDHTLNAHLSGSLRAGAELQSDRRREDQGSSSFRPHVESNLTYDLTGTTSLALSASYSSEEANVGDAPRDSAFRTGLRLNHVYNQRLTTNVSCYYRHDDASLRTGVRVSYAFSPRLSGNAAAYYRYDEDERGTLNNVESTSENAVDLSMGIQYSFTNHISANALYNHTEVDSELFGRSYARNRYSAALQFNF